MRTFSGKGKIHALTILKANAEFKEAFAQLGVPWKLPPNLHVKLEEFVCKLYATSSIDALWYSQEEYWPNNTLSGIFVQTFSVD